MGVFLKIKKLLVYHSFLGRILPDKILYQYSYRVLFGKKFSYSNPIGFNAKIQWLKINYHNPLIPKLTDKYEVRKYVSEIIGPEHLIPLIGIYSHPKEINWAKLPAKFVIKATHGSGWNMVCGDKNKQNKKLVHWKLKKWLHSNYYYSGKEWQYKNIQPRILCEENLQVKDKELLDIKLFCYHGFPKFIVAYESKSKQRTFYTKNWELLDCETSFKKGKTIEKPKNFELLISLASKLSKGFPFVRVDFLLQEDKIFFGELTFTPRNGLYLFNPPEFDLIFGKPLQVPLQEITVPIKQEKEQVSELVSIQ